MAKAASPLIPSAHGEEECNVSFDVDDSDAAVSSLLIPGDKMIHFREELCTVSRKISSADDSTSTTSSSTLVPEATDGGYGWVIVLASFLIHFTGDGIPGSFGVIFPVIQTQFNASKTATGVVTSLFLSLPLLLGPISGALTDVYDTRRMAIVGGVVALTGSLLSIFATNIWIFTFTFAVMTSIGLSFSFNASIVAVTFYFQKKRALATSLSLTGSSIGTAVLAPLMETVLRKFGWKQNLMCISALFFILIICGLLIKDLEWPQDTIEYKRKKFLERTERRKKKLALRSAIERSTSKFDFDTGGEKIFRNAISLPNLYSHFLDLLPHGTHRSRSVGQFLRCSTNYHMDMVTSTNETEMGLNDLNRAVITNDDESVGKNVGDAFSAAANHVASSPAGDLDIGKIRKDPHANVLGTTKATICETSHRKMAHTYGEVDFDHQKHRIIVKVGSNTQKNNECTKNVPKTVSTRNFGDGLPLVGIKVSRLASIVGPGSLLRDPQANSVYLILQREQSFSSNMNQRFPSAPALFIRRKRRFRSQHLIKIKDSMVELASGTKSLLLTKTFLMYLTSSFILCVFFDIPYINFPEFAVKNLNASEAMASYLVSGTGIANMCSIIVCGFLADFRIIKPHIIVFYGVFIMLAGICVLLAPYVQNYAQLLFLCCTYGIFISVNHVLSSVITINLLCLYDFQTGISTLNMAEGIGNLIGPAFVGFVYDYTRNYNSIFAIAGTAMMLSGLLMLAVQICLKFRSDDDDNSTV